MHGHTNTRLMVILKLRLSTLVVVVMETPIVVQIIIFRRPIPSYVIKHVAMTELLIVAIIEIFFLLSVSFCKSLKHCCHGCEIAASDVTCVSMDTIWCFDRYMLVNRWSKFDFTPCLSCFRPTLFYVIQTLRSEKELGMKCSTYDCVWAVRNTAKAQGTVVNWTYNTTRLNNMSVTWKINLTRVSSSSSSSSSSGPRAYAPDAPQPCRLIVLPSHYSSVLDVPTFYY